MSLFHFLLKDVTMQRPPPLTFDDLQRALQPLVDAQTTTAADVKQLMQDRVTRADLGELRDEMQEGFNRQDQRYYERGILDERYSGVTKRLDNLETQNKTALGRNIQIITTVLAVLGFLLALLTYLPHISFHP